MKAALAGSALDSEVDLRKNLLVVVIGERKSWHLLTQIGVLTEHDLGDDLVLFSRFRFVLLSNGRV